MLRRILLARNPQQRYDSTKRGDCHRMLDHLGRTSRIRLYPDVPSDLFGILLELALAIEVAGE